MPLPSIPKTDRKWPQRVSYITATSRPLNCLVFLLPIIVLQLVGQLVFPVELPTGGHLVNAAFSILQGIMSLFGTTTLYIPGLLVVIALLLWHWIEGYPWQVRGRTILGMAIESFLFAWPITVLANIVVSSSLACAASATVPASASNHAHNLIGQAVLMMGAGIYEELLFRLALIFLISVLLTWLSDLSEDYALIFAAIISALLFGAYHFMPGAITFNTGNFPIGRLFLFYFLSGIYFTGLYVLRGFGITVGAHIINNLIVLFLFGA